MPGGNCNPCDPTIVLCLLCVGTVYANGSSRALCSPKTPKPHECVSKRESEFLDVKDSHFAGSEGVRLLQSPSVALQHDHEGLLGLERVFQNTFKFCECPFFLKLEQCGQSRLK